MLPSAGRKRRGVRNGTGVDRPGAVGIRLIDVKSHTAARFGLENPGDSLTEVLRIIFGSNHVARAEIIRVHPGFDGQRIRIEIRGAWDLNEVVHAIETKSLSALTGRERGTVHERSVIGADGIGGFPFGSVPTHDPIGKTVADAGDVDSIACVAADHVARAGLVAADCGTGVCQRNTVACVAQGGIAGGIDADVVAFDDIRVARVLEQHAVLIVAADDVSRPGRRAANSVALRTAVEVDSVSGIAQIQQPCRIGADVISSNYRFCAASSDDHAGGRVAANDVSGARRIATDQGGIRSMHPNAGVGIAQNLIAHGVEADDVSLHGGTVGVKKMNTVAGVSADDIPRSRRASRR